MQIIIEKTALHIAVNQEMTVSYIVISKQKALVFFVQTTH